jgi:CRISPR-associated protein Cas1
MVRQKLDNQIGFLKKLKNARPSKENLFSLPLRTMETIRSGMELGEGNLDGTRDCLRGMEGSAGRAYFGCLSTLMPEKYRFQGRSKRPAQDPFNAVLNYGYGILYSRVEKACILAGLDPYAGFMHTDNYNKKSLVFDLIEPFRIFAEQPTVHLFTGRKIKDEYFDAQENAVSLNGKGKPVVVEAVNTFLEEPVRYRRRNVKRKHIIQHEAHRLANLLLAEEGVRRPDWMEIKEF